MKSVNLLCATGIAAILLGGTNAATAASKLVEPPQAESWITPAIWHSRDFEIMKQLRPVSIFRPSQFVRGKAYLPSAGTVNGLPIYTRAASGDLVNIKGCAISAELLVSHAYNAALVYVIFPKEMPTNQFDVLMNTRQTSAKMKAEVQRQLGMTAHWEPRETDVMTLAWNTNAPRSVKGPRELSSQEICSLKAFIPGGTGAVPAPLQENLGVPIIDPQGIAQGPKIAVGKYVCIDIPPELVSTARHGSLEEVNAMLTKKFGVCLIPSRATIPMLIVEKVPQPTFTVNR